MMETYSVPKAVTIVHGELGVYKRGVPVTVAANKALTLLTRSNRFRRHNKNVRPIKQDDLDEPAVELALLETVRDSKNKSINLFGGDGRPSAVVKTC